MIWYKLSCTVSNLNRSRFQVNPATLLIPLIFFFVSIPVINTKETPFPLLMWVVVFTACVFHSFPFICDIWGERREW